MLGRLGIVLLAGVIGFAGASVADEPVLTGTVVYLERMLLPAGAVAEVTLEDVSLADAPATSLGTVTVPAHTSPTPFTLPYDAAAITAGHSYALRASIRADGALMFATMDHVAFDPARLDGYELLVRRVADAAPSLYGAWLAEDIGGAGVLDDVQSTLTIAEDGTVSGRGGCNGFGGMATISGEKLSFGPLAGTLMACPEAVMDQERKFHDALAATAAFRLDAAERKLVLLDAAGTELVRFTAD
jgi:putative lipoprotein